MYKLYQNVQGILTARTLLFPPFSPGSTHGKGFFIFSLFITKTMSFWVCFLTLLTLFLSICLSLQQEPHFHAEQEREEIETNRFWDVIARELKLGQRSAYAVGGEAIRGFDGEPSRSPRRLLRLHRRHLRHRRCHVQGPLLSPLPFNVDLNLCIDLKFLCLWFFFFLVFFAVQAKLVACYNFLRSIALQLAQFRNRSQTGLHGHDVSSFFPFHFCITQTYFFFLMCMFVWINFIFMLMKPLGILRFLD